MPTPLQVFVPLKDSATYVIYGYLQASYVNNIEDYLHIILRNVDGLQSRQVGNLEVELSDGFLSLITSIAYVLF